MTQDKRFKKLVRARAKKMGTSYMAALSTMLRPEGEPQGVPITPEDLDKAGLTSIPPAKRERPIRDWKGRLGHQERKWRRFEDVLARVPLDRWECFGLVAPDYPGSLFKLYLRCGKARWWGFDFGPGAGQTNQDPVAYQRGLKPNGGLPPECVVHGPLSVLADLTCHPEKPALIRALELAKERLKMGNLVSSPAPRPPARATVIASRPKDHPQRDPVCGVLFVHGRPTARSPFGRTGVGSICHVNIVGDAMDFRSLTNILGDVTCPECKAVLANGGFCTEQSQMCDYCDRRPSEGHARSCRFVTVYSMSVVSRERRQIK